jgi:hypothetical protein
MPTRKRSQPVRQTSNAATRIKSGPLPPYGIAIRQAIARGDSQQMRKVALSARRYLSDVQSALDELKKAISKVGS